MLVFTIQQANLPRMILRLTLFLLTGALLLAPKLKAQVSNSPRQSGTGVLQGRVIDATTQEPLIGASVVIEKTQLGASTDTSGRFVIRAIPRGLYSVRATYLGYQTLVQYEIRIESGVTELTLALQEASTQTSEVEIVASNFSKSPTNLVSAKYIGQEQLRVNPGGNFDVSKVLQSLPGVSGSVSFRNDIIVRGGAPNENVFYLDGIETPIINHFATQGSGGGPVGIINSILLSNINFQASSFGAQYDNTLSSVFDFELLSGNRDRLQTRAIVSATEAGLTFDGPLSKNRKLTGLVSVRRSYLQFLFKAIGLPFLPDYWDGTAKLQWQLNDRTTLSYVGIGAIDNLTRNRPDNPTEDQLITLDGIPLSSLDTWTHGLTLKRLTPRGFFTVALSQNVLINRARLDRNDDPAQNRLSFYSREGEFRLRVNAVSRLGDWRLSYGAVAVLVDFATTTTDIVGVGDTNRVNTSGNFIRYGAHFAVSRDYFNGRLKTTAGLRSDLNDFTVKGDDPLEALSPRLSFSYALSSAFNLNGSLGRYYKLPPTLLLGWSPDGREGNYPNSGSRYWQTDHLVLGVDWQPEASVIVSIEGFLKVYDRYSVSRRTGASLANSGGNFGVFGNEPVDPVGKGRAYGVEVYAQKRLTKRVYGLVSYTLYRSEFTGSNPNNYVRSSWDNRHLLSITGGWQFGSNKQWELAGKWRYLGPFPYTPWRLDQQAALFYESRGVGLLDNTQLNANESPAFSQVDLRLERKWFFTKWNLVVFVDIQNVFNILNPTAPNFGLARNADQTYVQPLVPKLVANANSNRIPSIGIITKF